MNTFSASIDKFTQKAQDRIVSVPRASILDLFGLIVLATPVGNPEIWARNAAPANYVGGRLRGNWNLSLNRIDKSTTKTTDKNGVKVTQKSNNGMRNFKGETVYISNHLPYALSVEKGHSTQAPAGMLAVSVAQWNRIVKGNAK